LSFDEVAVHHGKEEREEKEKRFRNQKPEAEELIPYQDWLIRGSNQSNRGSPTFASA
jgi:hypothetical protein